MSTLLPTILIGLGSLLFLAGREVRLTMLGFFAQWAGIIWVLWVSEARGAGALSAAVEAAALLSTLAIVAVTLLGKSAPKETDETRPGSLAGARRTLAPAAALAGPNRRSQDWLLFASLAALAGVTGYGLSRLGLLATTEPEALGLYWVTLSATLSLVLDGARSAHKLGFGLLALLNAACLLAYLLSAGTPAVGLLAMLALARIGSALLFAYIWLLLGARFGTLNLNALFDRRKESSAQIRAIVPSVRRERGGPLAVVPDEEPAGD